VNVGQRLIIPDITRHTVVAGDTLSALASRFYGDAALYPLIEVGSPQRRLRITQQRRGHRLGIRNVTGGCNSTRPA